MSKIKISERNLRKYLFEMFQKQQRMLLEAPNPPPTGSEGDNFEYQGLENKEIQLPAKSSQNQQKKINIDPDKFQEYIRQNGTFFKKDKGDLIKHWRSNFHAIRSTLNQALAGELDFWEESPDLAGPKNRTGQRFNPRKAEKDDAWLIQKLFFNKDTGFFGAEDINNSPLLNFFSMIARDLPRNDVDDRADRSGLIEENPETFNTSHIYHADLLDMPSSLKDYKEISYQLAGLSSYIKENYPLEKFPFLRYVTPDKNESGSIQVNLFLNIDDLGIDIFRFDDNNTTWIKNKDDLKNTLNALIKDNNTNRKTELSKLIAFKNSQNIYKLYFEESSKKIYLVMPIYMINHEEEKQEQNNTRTKKQKFIENIPTTTISYNFDFKGQNINYTFKNAIKSEDIIKEKKNPNLNYLVLNTVIEKIKNNKAFRGERLNPNELHLSDSAKKLLQDEMNARLKKIGGRENLIKHISIPRGLQMNIGSIPGMPDATDYISTDAQDALKFTNIENVLNTLNNQKVLQSDKIREVMKKMDDNSRNEILNREIQTKYLEEANKVYLQIYSYNQKLQMQNIIQPDQLETDEFNIPVFAQSTTTKLTLDTAETKAIQSIYSNWEYSKLNKLLNFQRKHSDNYWTKDDTKAIGATAETGEHKYVHVGNFRNFDDLLPGHDTTGSPFSFLMSPPTDVITEIKDNKAKEFTKSMTSINPGVQGTADLINMASMFVMPFEPVAAFTMSFASSLISASNRGSHIDYLQNMLEELVKQQKNFTKDNQQSNEPRIVELYNSANTFVSALEDLLKENDVKLNINEDDEFNRKTKIFEYFNSQISSIISMERLFWTLDCAGWVPGVASYLKTRVATYHLIKTASSAATQSAIKFTYVKKITNYIDQTGNEISEKAFKALSSNEAQNYTKKFAYKNYDITPDQIYRVTNNIPGAKADDVVEDIIIEFLEETQFKLFASKNNLILNKSSAKLKEEATIGVDNSNVVLTQESYDLLDDTSKNSFIETIDTNGITKKYTLNANAKTEVEKKKLTITLKKDSEISDDIIHNISSVKTTSENQTLIKEFINNKKKIYIPDSIDAYSDLINALSKEESGLLKSDSFDTNMITQLNTLTKENPQSLKERLILIYGKIFNVDEQQLKMLKDVLVDYKNSLTTTQNTIPNNTIKKFNEDLCRFTYDLPLSNNIDQTLLTSFTKSLQEIPAENIDELFYTILLKRLQNKLKNGNDFIKMPMRKDYIDGNIVTVNFDPSSNPIISNQTANINYDQEIFITIKPKSKISNVLKPNNQSRMYRMNVKDKKADFIDNELYEQYLKAPNDFQISYTYQENQNMYVAKNQLTDSGTHYKKGDQINQNVYDALGLESKKKFVKPKPQTKTIKIDNVKNKDFIEKAFKKDLKVSNKYRVKEAFNGYSVGQEINTNTYNTLTNTDKAKVMTPVETHTDDLRNFFTVINDIKVSDVDTLNALLLNYTKTNRTGNAALIAGKLNDVKIDKTAIKNLENVLINSRSVPMTEENLTAAFQIIKQFNTSYMQQFKYLMLSKISPLDFADTKLKQLYDEYLELLHESPTKIGDATLTWDNLNNQIESARGQIAQLIPENTKAFKKPDKNYITAYMYKINHSSDKTLAGKAIVRINRLYGTYKSIFDFFEDFKNGLTNVEKICADIEQGLISIKKDFTTSANQNLEVIQEIDNMITHVTKIKVSNKQLINQIENYNLYKPGAFNLNFKGNADEVGSFINGLFRSTFDITKRVNYLFVNIRQFFENTTGSVGKLSSQFTVIGYTVGSNFKRFLTEMKSLWDEMWTLIKSTDDIKQVKGDKLSQIINKANSLLRNITSSKETDNLGIKFLKFASRLIILPAKFILQYPVLTHYIEKNLLDVLKDVQLANWDDIELNTTKLIDFWGNTQYHIVSKLCLSAILSGNTSLIAQTQQLIAGNNIYFRQLIQGLLIYKKNINHIHKINKESSALTAISDLQKLSSSGKIYDNSATAEQIIDIQNAINNIVLKRHPLIKNNNIKNTIVVGQDISGNNIEEDFDTFLDNACDSIDPTKNANSILIRNGDKYEINKDFIDTEYKTSEGKEAYNKFMGNLMKFLNVFSKKFQAIEVSLYQQKHYKVSVDNDKKGKIISKEKGITEAYQEISDNLLKNIFEDSKFNIKKTNTPPATQDIHKLPQKLSFVYFCKIISTLLINKKQENPTFEKIMSHDKLSNMSLILQKDAEQIIIKFLNKNADAELESIEAYDKIDFLLSIVDICKSQNDSLFSLNDFANSNTTLLPLVLKIATNAANVDDFTQSKLGFQIEVIDKLKILIKNITEKNIGLNKINLKLKTSNQQKNIKTKSNQTDDDTDWQGVAQHHREEIRQLKNDVDLRIIKNLIDPIIGDFLTLASFLNKFAMYAGVKADIKNTNGKNKKVYETFIDGLILYVQTTKMQKIFDEIKGLTDFNITDSVSDTNKKTDNDNLAEYGISLNQIKSITKPLDVISLLTNGINSVRLNGANINMTVNTLNDITSDESLLSSVYQPDGINSSRIENLVNLTIEKLNPVGMNISNMSGDPAVAIDEIAKASISIDNCIKSIETIEKLYSNILDKGVNLIKSTKNYLPENIAESTQKIIKSLNYQSIKFNNISSLLKEDKKINKVSKLEKEIESQQKYKQLNYRKNLNYNLTLSSFASNLEKNIKSLLEDFEFSLKMLKESGINVDSYEDIGYILKIAEYLAKHKGSVEDIMSYNKLSKISNIEKGISDDDSSRFAKVVSLFKQDTFLNKFGIINYAVLSTEEKRKNINEFYERNSKIINLKNIKSLTEYFEKNINNSKNSTNEYELTRKTKRMLVVIKIIYKYINEINNLSKTNFEIIEKSPDSFSLLKDINVEEINKDFVEKLKNLYLNSSISIKKEGETYISYLQNIFQKLSVKQKMNKIYSDSYIIGFCSSNSKIDKVDRLILASTFNAVDDNNLQNQMLKNVPYIYEVDISKIYNILPNFNIKFNEPTPIDIKLTDVLKEIGYANHSFSIFSIKNEDIKYKDQNNSISLLDLMKKLQLIDDNIDTSLLFKE